MSEPQVRDSSFPIEPARLLEGRDRVAMLLRAEQNRHPGASPTFSHLRLASARQQTRRFATMVLSALVPLFLVLLLPRTEPTLITAEEFLIPVVQDSERAGPAPSRTSDGPVVPETSLDSKKDVEPNPAREVQMPPRTITPATPPEKAVDSVELSHNPPEGASAAVRAVDCSLLSRAGKFDAALKCLKKASRETGMSAELSLLESARLRAQVMGDSEGALADLGTYTERFPEGALRREAGLLELKVLVTLGRSREARAAVDQLLPQVPEQKTTLYQHALELDLALGDCGGARKNVEVLESLGAFVRDAQERLETCESIEKQ